MNFAGTLTATVAGLGGLAAGVGLAWSVMELVRLFGESFKVLVLVGAGAFVVSVTIGLVWVGYSYSKR